MLKALQFADFRPKLNPNAAGTATIPTHPSAAIHAIKRLHNFREMDEVFKALADPTRRELLDRLRAENGQTLGQLCQQLDMSRQAVTKHLAILASANLVVTVWQGRDKLHYLNPTPINEIYVRWISKYERRRLQALSDVKQDLEKKRKKTSS